MILFRLGIESNACGIFGSKIIETFARRRLAAFLLEDIS